MELRLTTKPSRYRSGVARSAREETQIDRTGGKWHAGLIRGISLSTIGEALGHALWGDAAFIAQVTEAANAQSRGVKCRFTHPDMSADGMAHYLGRILDVRVSEDGRHAYGDLHLAPSSHDTPDGDLGKYVMDRCEEDPTSCGMSIVFERDFDLEHAFAMEHGATQDEAGYIDLRSFRSPDPANISNYPHARLHKLWGCDAVDDPAANPGGMFHDGPIREFEATASYAIGLTDQAPATTSLGVNADRLRDYTRRFLQTHRLSIVPVDPSFSAPLAGQRHLLAEPPTSPAPAAVVSADSAIAPRSGDTAHDPSPEDSESHTTTVLPLEYPVCTETISDGVTVEALKSDPPTDTFLSADATPQPVRDPLTLLNVYLEAFGDVGARYLADGLTFEAATRKHCSDLVDRLAAANNQLSEATAKLAEQAAQRARFATTTQEEPSPLKSSPDSNTKTFQSLFRIRK